MLSNKRSTLFLIDGKEAIDINQLKRSELREATKIQVRKGTRTLGARITAILSVYESKIDYID